MMLTCALQGLFLKDTFWRGILCCAPHAGRYSAAPTGNECERMLLSNPSVLLRQVHNRTDVEYLDWVDRRATLTEHP